MSRNAISAADRVEILVLVDNVTDNLSSVPGNVENEWPRLRKRGIRSARSCSIRPAGTLPREISAIKSVRKPPMLIRNSTVSTAATNWLNCMNR